LVPAGFWRQSKFCYLREMMAAAPVLMSMFFNRKTMQCWALTFISFIGAVMSI